MNLLLLGATGLVGKNVLAQALADPTVTSVVAPTRRALAPHPKLRNPVADSLGSFLSDGFPDGIDGVICALGTTIAKAGSKEAFREVDYQLPLSFAKSAREHDVGTFVLVTASTANANSSIFYSKTKGEVEREIERVGFPSLTIVRPGLIEGEREESRFMESVGLRLMSLLGPLVPKKMRINPAPVIAAACLGAFRDGKPGVHYCLAESMVGA
ncbi:NAD(P)H-binding protein [Terriglobus roseus]|uniref:Uncharacterized conserved protein YbjT, contains NAD(P)-binding and DUF2867 domains n=1 Tax=Terriglobus roseus TaxID=392734 RepID=A0A1G7PVV7_9BACT|nr:NAD(P)H-binding protein [Terriglobus roseus]SDF90391.1 Uncharacterized conserved protein YbjT, contains NAD(P)-binding and DUF2867 domains [Terriglobus roseus]